MRTNTLGKVDNPYTKGYIDTKLVSTVSIEFMQGAIPLLTEVLVLKGIGVCNVHMMARDKVIALIGSVRVATLKQPKEELETGDQKVREE